MSWMYGFEPEFSKNFKLVNLLITFLKENKYEDITEKLNNDILYDLVP